MERSSAVVVSLLLLVPVITAAWIASPSVPVTDAPGPGPSSAADGQRVVALDVENEGPYVWPYVATERSFEARASSINVVLAGDADRVKWLFTGQADGWSEDERNATDDPSLVQEDDRVVEFDWRDTDGAARYIYVVPNRSTERGAWREPAYQLHAGSFFGKQYHLRVYDVTGPEGDWTVIQAHAEHWDWFALTHTVDSLDEPRQYVESEFMGHPSVTDVRRDYFRNSDTYDADGWASVITLAAIGGLAAFVPGRVRSALRRASSGGVDARHALLFLAVLAVPLGVRAGGILLEQYASWVDTRTIGRGLYVVFVAGTPLGAYAFGRDLPRYEAFAVGALAFATAVLVDYAYLSIATLPLVLVVHRVVAALALGAISAGRPTADGRTDDGLLLALGVVAWIGVAAFANVV